MTAPQIAQVYSLADRRRARHPAAGGAAPDRAPPARGVAVQAIDGSWGLY